MKISELINKLEQLKEKHGDNDLYFRARDAYSIYGEEMEIVGDEKREFWEGTYTHDGMTIIDFALNDKVDYDSDVMKQPKITFRK